MSECTHGYGNDWCPHFRIAWLEQRLAAAEAALREILDRAEEDDVVSCIAIASKAIGLRMFVGNPPNSEDEAANGVQGCPLGKSNEDLASQHGQ